MSPEKTPPMSGRERLLALLDGRPVDRLPAMPITMMFAADRLGVPYRRYATEHSTLVEAQLRVAEEFELDHVSAISDPAREAADCGAAVEYFEDQPPAIDESRALLADKDRLRTLEVPDPCGGGRMEDRVAAVALFREQVGGKKLIEGWVEGPCAEAADLRGINALMLDFYDDPAFVRAIFDFAVETAVLFARAQVEAGADIIGVGDAAVSLIGPRFYEQFVWPAEKRLVDAVHDTGARVRLHICGNTSHILANLGTLASDIVDLDFLAPMAAGRRAMRPQQVLLGNIDPVRVLRDGDADTVTAALRACHRDAGPRYIVGAGCEVPRDVPVENLRALVEYARSHHPEDTD